MAAFTISAPSPRGGVASGNAIVTPALSPRQGSREVSKNTGTGGNLLRPPTMTGNGNGNGPIAGVDDIEIKDEKSALELIRPRSANGPKTPVPNAAAIAAVEAGGNAKDGGSSNGSGNGSGSAPGTPGTPASTLDSAERANALRRLNKGTVNTRAVMTAWAPKKGKLDPNGNTTTGGGGGTADDGTSSVAIKKAKDPALADRMTRLVSRLPPSSSSNPTCRQRVRHCACRIYDPRESGRVYWDVAVFMALVYNIIEIPIRVCFSVDPVPWSPTDILNLLIDCFFLCDVWANFRTGYYIDTRLVTSTALIRKKYVRGWFLVDFLTSIPISNILSAFESPSNASLTRLPRLLRIFRIARMFKLLRMFKLMKVMSAWGEHASASAWALAMKIFNFVLLVFMLSHLAGCIWGLIAINEMEDSPIPGDPATFSPMSWPNRIFGYQTFDDAGLGTMYLLSFYWALTTLTTLGYGDINAFTSTELAYASVIIFVGTCLFGYTLGLVSSIMAHGQEAANLIRKKMKEINYYMKYRKLSPELQEKVRDHFRYAWKRSTVYDERVIMDELPTYLKTELALHLNQDLIQAVPFLKDMGNDSVVLLVLRLKPLQVSPGQYVFKKGMTGREMYFVSKGEVEVIGAGNEAICTLAKGSYFGEYAILADTPIRRTASIRARSFVDLLSLSKSDFEEVWRLYPGIYGKIIARAKVQWQKAMKVLGGGERGGGEEESAAPVATPAIIAHGRAPGIAAVQEGEHEDEPHDGEEGGQHHGEGQNDGNNGDHQHPDNPDNQPLDREPELSEEEAWIGDDRSAAGDDVHDIHGNNGEDGVTGTGIGEETTNDNDGEHKRVASDATDATGVGHGISTTMDALSIAAMSGDSKRQDGELSPPNDNANNGTNNNTGSGASSSEATSPPQLTLGGANSTPSFAAPLGIRPSSGAANGNSSSSSAAASRTTTTSASASAAAEDTSTYSRSGSASTTSAAAALSANDVPNSTTTATAATTTNHNTNNGEATSPTPTLAINVPAGTGATIAGAPPAPPSVGVVTVPSPGNPRMNFFIPASSSNTGSPLRSPHTSSDSLAGGVAGIPVLDSHHVHPRGDSVLAPVTVRSPSLQRATINLQQMMAHANSALPTGSGTAPATATTTTPVAPTPSSLIAPALVGGRESPMILSSPISPHGRLSHHYTTTGISAPPSPQPPSTSGTSITSSSSAMTSSSVGATSTSSASVSSSSSSASTSSTTAATTTSTIPSDNEVSRILRRRGGSNDPPAPPTLLSENGTATSASTSTPTPPPVALSEQRSGSVSAAPGSGPRLSRVGTLGGPAPERGSLVRPNFNNLPLRPNTNRTSSLPHGGLAGTLPADVQQQIMNKRKTYERSEAKRMMDQAAAQAQQLANALGNTQPANNASSGNVNSLPGGGVPLAPKRLGTRGSSDSSVDPVLAAAAAVQSLVPPPAPLGKRSSLNRPPQLLTVHSSAGSELPSPDPSSNGAAMGHAALISAHLGGRAGNNSDSPRSGDAVLTPPSSDASGTLYLNPRLKQRNPSVQLSPAAAAGITSSTSPSNASANGSNSSPKLGPSNPRGRSQSVVAAMGTPTAGSVPSNPSSRIRKGSVIPAGANHLAPHGSSTSIPGQRPTSPMTEFLLAAANGNPLPTTPSMSSVPQSATNANQRPMSPMTALQMGLDPMTAAMAAAGTLPQGRGGRRPSVAQVAMAALAASSSNANARAFPPGNSITSPSNASAAGAPPVVRRSSNPNIDSPGRNGTNNNPGNVTSPPSSHQTAAAAAAFASRLQRVVAAGMSQADEAAERIARRQEAVEKNQSSMELQLRGILDALATLQQASTLPSHSPSAHTATVTTTVITTPVPASSNITAVPPPNVPAA